MKSKFSTGPWRFYDNEAQPNAAESKEITAKAVQMVNALKAIQRLLAMTKQTNVGQSHETIESLIDKAKGEV